MSTETEELVDLGVNLEDAVPCQWLSPSCDREAEWAVINRCCGQTFSLCDEHRIKSDAYVKGIPASWILCTGCGASGVVFDWRRL